MAKRSVAVRLSGQEYRIRSDASAEWLQKVAAAVDAAMGQVRERAGVVDTLEVALLTSLNLAQEVIRLRERVKEAEASGAKSERIEALIAMASAAMAGDGEPEEAALFELPKSPPSQKSRREKTIDPLIASADEILAEQKKGARRPPSSEKSTRAARGSAPRA